MLLSIEHTCIGVINEEVHGSSSLTPYYTNIWIVLRFLAPRALL